MSLSVKPLSATLELDTDTIGDSDPYVVMILGNDKKKSPVCKNGGVKPTWDEASEFKAKETVITFQIWDKDTFSPDDQMGEAIFDLKNILQISA